MNILLTGGAGYIGSVTAEALLEKGHKVVVYDNLSTGHPEAVPPKAVFVQGDLSQKEVLKDLMRAGEIDAVVHFAASSIVSESVADPAKYYSNNLVNGLSLLEAMRESAVKRIIFSSTAAVYGDPRQVPIKEEDPTLPTNPYGETKLAIEKMLAWHSNAYGISYVALRYFNAAGASPALGEDHSPETHLIPLVLQATMGKRESVTVNGIDYSTPDGSCIRDYIHVMDLAGAHVLALEAQGNKVYNLGNGEGYSVLEVIRAVEKVTGRTVPVKHGPRRPGDPPILVASAEKIQKELGWKPKFASLESIIESAWRWRQKYPEGYGS